MDNSRHWKVITRPDEIVGGGVYQEKTAIICPPDQKEDFEKLKKMVIDLGADIASIPSELSAAVEREGLLVFVYWSNKQTPTVSEKELRAGNIRIKVTDGI